ncbi:MAG: MFS transporter [Gemmataceae bacterium]|nr:MFS transporter [Gemmataceae bacterium]
MQETNPATPVPSSAEINRSALMIVFLVVFIDLLGFGIVLPMLPRIADDYVNELLPSSKTGEGLQGLVVGLLMSSFSLMQFLFAPFWGRVSDRVGRRPILLLGLIGSVVFYALFGYAASLPGTTMAGTALVLFFVARIGAGIAGATIATAQAVIADSTPPDKRKHGMAIIGAAFGIGFAFGPLIGAGSMELFPNNAEAIGYVAAALSLAAFALGYRLLPETRRVDTGPPQTRRWLDPAALARALANGAIGPVILTFFLATLGFGAFEVTLALLLRDSFGLKESQSFLIFSYVGFVLLLTQGYLYRKLAKRWSEVAFIALGIVLMAGGVGALGAVTYAASTGWSLYGLLFAALTSAVVGFAFLTPSANALISRRTDANQQGEILGVNQSASALARILGPVLGVTLYKSTASHLLPYALGAGLLILMLPMIPKIRRG